MTTRRLLYVVLAIALGAMSPTIARLFDFSDVESRTGLLYWWFMVAPVEVDMLIWPAEEYQYFLWATVYTLQYLALFAIGTSVPPLARMVEDFFWPNRHRRFKDSLARRRANAVMA